MCKSAVCERPETDVVKSEIEKKLELFDDMVKLSGIIEIDGVLYKGDTYKDIEIKEDCIKVLNKNAENAYLVTVKSLLEQDISNVVEAMETGITNKLQGVTRIVGFYSRISQWNKGKIGELKDRIRGNYWENSRVNTKDTTRFVDNGGVGV